MCVWQTLKFLKHSLILFTVNSTRLIDDIYFTMIVEGQVIARVLASTIIIVFKLETSISALKKDVVFIVSYRNNSYLLLMRIREI